MPFIKTPDTRPKTFHVRFTAEIQPPSSVAEANLAASDDSVFLATGCQATDTQFNKTRITYLSQRYTISANYYLIRYKKITMITRITTIWPANILLDCRDKAKRKVNMQKR